MVEAARAACIHDVISTRFPLKYDTVVGERGLRLRCVCVCMRVGGGRGTLQCAVCGRGCGAEGGGTCAAAVTMEAEWPVGLGRFVGARALSPPLEIPPSATTHLPHPPHPRS